MLKRGSNKYLASASWQHNAFKEPLTLTVIVWIFAHCKDSQNGEGFVEKPHEYLQDESLQLNMQDPKRATSSSRWHDGALVFLGVHANSTARALQNTNTVASNGKALGAHRRNRLGVPESMLSCAGTARLLRREKLRMSSLEGLPGPL